MAGLQMKVDEEQIKTEYGKNSFIAILFMTGWVWMYARAFATISESWWLFAIAGGVLCVGMLALYETKIEALVLVAGLVVNMVGFIISFFFFPEGIRCLANDFLRFLTGKTGRIYLDYPATNEKQAYMVTFWIFFLVAVWTVNAVKYRKKTILGILVFLMAGSAIWGLVPVDWGFVLVMLAVALFLFPVENKYKNENTKKRQSRLQATIMNLLHIGMSCMIVVILIFTTNKDFSTENGIAAVEAQLHQWKYEKQSGAMPEGKLSDLGAREKGNKTVLTITMEEPQKLYLRGMVGEIYTGTEWQPQSAERYIETEDVFYWLHKMGFYGQSSIGNAMLLIGEEQPQEMTIQNVAACSKYQYLPYALIGNRILDQRGIGDGSVFAKNTDEIIISYMKGSLPQWYQTKVQLVQKQKDKNVQEYLKQEQTYQKFVKEQNLQVTNEVIGVCQRMLKEVQREKTLGEITALIRNTLEERLDYSEKIITQNGANDFFQYTLEQSKKGYSVHYATVATLMLRYCGVPARYVEGYFLSEEEAAGYEKGDTILLTEEHSHAWAEYYLDGIGWIPFEVTPGYIDEKELSEVQEMFAGDESSEYNEQTYKKNNLSYQASLDLMPEENADKEEPLLLSWWKILWIIIGMLLIILEIIIIDKVIRRRKCLKKILEETRQEDHRGAILAQYGYAGMLCKYAKITDIERMQQAQSLNQEALFSNHRMTAEQRQCMEGYLAEVLNICKGQWSVWKKIWYRYVLGLYR